MKFGSTHLRQQWVPLTQAGTAIFIVAFFLYFAGAGLWAGFTRDDLHNLHLYVGEGFTGVVRSFLVYWSAGYRPLGGLVYLAVYHLFGLDPLPFRIVCFVILLANLYLGFLFVVRLSGSRATGLTAALLLCYHAWFVDLYYSSGTIYDLLCFLCYFGAFLQYLRIRRSGRNTVKAWAGFLALYLAALNAKEMAVTLPLFVAVYEIIYFPPRPRGLRRWIAEHGMGALATGLITLPYVLGKLLLEGGLLENPAYRLNVSPTVFLDTFHLYLNHLLYQEHTFRDPNTVQLLLVMLGFAIWRRRPHLLFAWAFLLLSGLPVLFMAHYGAFFMYIPFVGWALYAAGTVTELGYMLHRAGVRVFGEQTGDRILPEWHASAFLVIAAMLAAWHQDESRKTLAHFQSARMPFAEMSEDLKRLQPDLPHGSNIYFADDPLPPNRWELLFLVRLLYHDMTLNIGRDKPGAVPPPVAERYHAAFDYRDGHFVPITPPKPDGN